MTIFSSQSVALMPQTSEVADLVKEKYKEILNNPDYILKDSKNEDTVWVIRDIKKNKMNKKKIKRNRKEHIDSCKKKNT